MLYFTIRESDFLMNGLMATKREILFYNLRDSKIGWNNLCYLKWHRSVSSIKEFIIYLFNTVTRRKQIIRRRGARYRNRDVNR